MQTAHSVLALHAIVDLPSRYRLISYLFSFVVVVDAVVRMIHLIVAFETDSATSPGMARATTPTCTPRCLHPPYGSGEFTSHGLSRI